MGILQSDYPLELLEVVLHEKIWYTLINPAQKQKFLAVLQITLTKAELSLAHCSTLGSTLVGSMVLPLYAIASKSGSHKLFHSSTYEYLCLLAFDIVDYLHTNSQC